MFEKIIFPQGCINRARHDANDVFQENSKEAKLVSAIDRYSDVKEVQTERVITEEERAEMFGEDGDIVASPHIIGPRPALKTKTATLGLQKLDKLSVDRPRQSTIISKIARQVSLTS